MAKVHISVDLKDLEKMLNLDDPEVALKFSSNVIQQFSKRYLKDIVKDESFSLVEKRLKAAVAKVVEEEIGTEGNWNKPLQVSDKLKQRIEWDVKHAVEAVIYEAKDKAVEECVARLTPLIDSTVERYTLDLVKTKVDEAVNERLTKALKG